MLIDRNNTIEQISENLKPSSTLYCFGAGAMGKDFCDFAKDNGIDLKQMILVDNNAKKWNTNLDIDGINISIISKESMLSRITPCDIIVIATLACKEIYDDLTAYDKLAKTKVYFSQLIFTNKISSEKADITLPKGEPIIPKIIHYCWFGRNKIPDELQRYIDGWAKKCPDYKIIQWNEENYDITKNEYMHQAYKAKRWGFVPDYARLDILYNFGGIYLDTDVELVKSLDDLLCNKAFFSLSAQLKVNTGNGFGAIPKHPLLKKMRDYYDNISFVNSDGTINTAPCNEHQYNVLKNNQFKITGKHFLCDDYLVLPLQLMCGYNHYIDEHIVAENAFSIHHIRRSWLDDKMKNHATESIKFLKKLR